MNTEWLKARQTKYAAYATTYIIIILAVLVVANFLANRYNKSFDATANKRYSLSDQTKKIVHDLKQDVTIQYFDKPTGMQAGKDLLDRYAHLSPKDPRRVRRLLEEAATGTRRQYHARGRSNCQ